MGWSGRLPTLDDLSVLSVFVAAWRRGGERGGAVLTGDAK
jgi:hypothetical protein